MCWGMSRSMPTTGKGNRLTETDANGNTTRYAYDEQIFTVDGNGNLKTKTDPDGYVTTYGYNGLDMVTSINYNDGKEVTYQYNKVGDLVEMTDWTGTTTFEVDLLNRITKTTDTKGKVVSYTYDATGNQTSVSYPDDTTATKTYDLLGQLKTVTEHDGRTTTYTYDGMGRTVKMEYPHGWVEDYHYDSIGQLLKVEDTDPSGKDMKQQKHVYKYDDCGNMTYEYMRGNGTGEATVENFYTYDALHRVTNAKENYGNASRTYQYDSLGNLTWETNSNNVTTDYKLNNLNQITEKSSNGWKTHTTFTYEKRGNLIQEQYGKNKKVTSIGTYTYDETNKMVKGVNANAESSSYLYNGLGALVEQTWVIAKNSYGYHDVLAEAVEPVAEEPETAADTVDSPEIPAPSDDNTTETDAALDEAPADSADSGIMLLAAPKKDDSGKKPSDKPTGSEVKKTSTVVKEFVVDYTTETHEPLMEHEVNGLDYRYVYGNDRLSVNITGVETGSSKLMENGNQIRLYYHMDYLGTADYLTSPLTGKVESWTHYNEWGEITHNAVLKCGQRELDLVKRYATHDFDAVLNQYYAKARFYDAENRHFTAMDPILDPSQYDISEYTTDSMQLVQYLYVQDNVLVHIDPDGRIPVSKFPTLLQSYKQGNISQMIKDLTKYNSQSKSPLHILAQVITAGEVWKDSLRSGTTLLGTKFEAPIKDKEGKQRYIDVLVQAKAKNGVQALAYPFEVKTKKLAKLGRSELNNIYFPAVECNGFILDKKSYDNVLRTRILFDKDILRTRTYAIHLRVEHNGRGLITYDARFRGGSKNNQEVYNEAFYRITNAYYRSTKAAENALTRAIDDYVYTITGKQLSQLTADQVALLGMATSAGAILVSGVAFVGGYTLAASGKLASVTRTVIVKGGAAVKIVFDSKDAIASEITRWSNYFSNILKPIENFG